MNLKLIGNNIKYRRNELKLTQAELAEKANVSTVHISHIETGKVAMSLECLLAISMALGITPNDILLGQYLYHSEQKSSVNEKPDSLTQDDYLLLQYMKQYLHDRNKSNK